MVDYVKVGSNKINPSTLTAIDLLDFKDTFDIKTGEVKGKQIAMYKGLKIIIYPSNYVEIKGSLHKFKNNGRYNHDDFTFCDLQKVLKEISSSLGIDLKKCFIKNIEFGVNITPPICTADILRGLMLHKSVEFKNVHGGDYRQAVHQRYIIKAYDKCLQYNLDSQLFRCELKFRKMVDLNKLGIETLNDLLSPHWVIPVMDMLTKAWNEIIYFDHSIYPIDNGDYCQKKLAQWSNPNFWSELTKQRRYTEKIKYKRIEEKFSEHIHQTIYNLMIDKWMNLFETELPINRKLSKAVGYQLTV